VSLKSIGSNMMGLVRGKGLKKVAKNAGEKAAEIKDKVSLGNKGPEENKLSKMGGKTQAHKTLESFNKGFKVIEGGMIGLFVGAVIGSIITGGMGPVIGTLAAGGFASMGMLAGGFIGGSRAKASK